MVNATAFPELYGWQYLNDTTQFNPIKAAVVTLQSSPAGGLAWTLTALGIVFLIPTLIYIRTQNILATSFGLLLVNMLMHYGAGSGSLIPGILLWPIYLIAVLGIGLGMASTILKKKGEL